MLGPYAIVLRAPGVLPVVAAALVSGVAVLGAQPIVLVLFVEEQTGAFAAAGAVTAAYALAAAGTSPLRGRLIDRRGQTGPLLGFALVNAAALGGLLAAGLAGAPAVALVALAVLAGGAAAPMVPALRALWGGLVGDEVRDTAYALLAILIEAMFVGGPLLAGAMAVVLGPAVALATVVAASLASALAFVATRASRAWAPGGRARASGGRWGALSTPAMRTLALSQVPYGAAIGALDVLAPAFASLHGDAAAGAILISALAVGSLVGGVVYGARRWPGSPAGRYAAALGFLALALVPAAVLDSLPALAVVLAVAGLAIAPSTAIVFGLIDDAAPAGTVTEAATWITTAYAAGVGAGAALAGALADRSIDGALVLLPAAAGIAAVLVLARWATLRPATRV